MALSNVSVWQRSRFTLQCFIINLVGSLAWLSAVALAEFEWREAVSGSGSISGMAFMCLGSLAVFVMAFTRGRLDMENGARDFLATTRGPKLNAINGCGLTTRPQNDLRDVDVVMLSMYNERPHSSLTQFMRYISHCHALESILLQFSPFRPEKCEGHLVSACRCVVFEATEEIMIMIAHRLPRTLKPLPTGGFLLPSLSCHNNGCHGCNQGLLYVPYLRDVEAAAESSELRTSQQRWREENPRVQSPAAAVCEALDQFLIEEEENSCICIPLHLANDDRWTKFLIKFLKSEGISGALQRYITRSAEELGFTFGPGTIEIYNSASFIVPRVVEVIVNIVLRVWLRIDGFSSSLLARLASRDYGMHSTGTGFSANAFLTQALVFGSADWTNVCQVLEFRRGILSARRVSQIVGCVNVSCSITWSVLIACEGNWAPSTPLCTPRLALIIVAIGVALGMDCYEIYVIEARRQVQARAWARAEARAQGGDRARDWALAEAHVEAQVRAGIWVGDWDWVRAWYWAWALAPGQVWALMAAVILEVGCIVSLVVMLSMKKGLGRWVYGGMQVLVWVKWGIGSVLLGDNPDAKENRGTWVYFSAFLLWVGMLPQWEYFKLVM